MPEETVPYALCQSEQLRDRSGPSCSKHRKLNELIKRSTRSVFYDFITKYTEFFVEKMRESFTNFFDKKYWHV